ncbi:MAG: MmgE/PrpD family protein [Planctomycetia bacterium]|nr:MmgE/PrpD family protein [Planctomycetia bacterium]
MELAAGGDDFAVMGMHFKLGLYEHQSAGAIAGLIDLIAKNPQLLDDAAAIDQIRITIYEPAFSIIGDPHKRDPRTRQSADHSMVYIVATLLRKAVAARRQGTGDRRQESLWKELMLMPEDYGKAALFDPLTRQFMRKIDFRHGGPQYDAKYPEGLPTSVEIEHRVLGTLSSGLVMYPEGHARNTSGNLPALLAHKFRRLAAIGVSDIDGLHRRLSNLIAKSPSEIRDLYSFEINHVRPA